VEKKAGGASMGGKRLEGVMRGVGLASAGVVGPMGRLSNVLLGFAPSGLVVGAAVLGLGVLSKAFEGTAKAAEESAARVKAAVSASLVGAPKELSALAQAGVIGEEGIGPLIARAQGLNKLFAISGGNWAQSREGKAILAEIARLQGRQTALGQVGALGREDTLAGSWAASQNALAGSRGITAPGVFIPEFAQMAQLTKTLNKDLLADALKMVDAMTEQTGATQDYLGTVMRGIELAHDAEMAEGALARAELEHAQAARAAAAALITAGAQMIAGIIQSLKGGDFWGSLAGLGGLISLIPGGQIAGAVVGGVGIVGGSLFAPSAAAAPVGGAPMPMAPVVQHFTVIGENDPRAQASIANMARSGVLRGYGRG